MNDHFRNQGVFCEYICKKCFERIKNMKKNMRKIVWVLLLVIWVFLVVISHVNAEEIKESELYAQAAVLMDADSGRVLYGKNSEAALAMASTTKIMTCIIALENGELSDMVEISSYAASMPEVKLGVRKGETYGLKDLLYSLMLESHNDAAVAIAEHIGRSLIPEDERNEELRGTTEESKQAVAAFAKLMNEKAKELGCENTWFITPNGLDAEEVVEDETGESVTRYHQTTAKELALIMSYCILDSPQSEQFLKITQTPSYTFQNGNGRSFACYNHNAFLNMMSGVISGKTGFTNKAGYCYVGALERDGRKYVVALLACGWPYNKNYKWADTRKLMEYGIENYFYRSFSDIKSSHKKWLKDIPVLEGQTDKLDEQAYVPVQIEEREEEEAVREGLLMKEGEEIQVEYQIEQLLQAPVEEGMKVGEVHYMLDGRTYYSEEIVTAEAVEKIDWQWCLEQIFIRFFSFG